MKMLVAGCLCLASFLLVACETRHAARSGADTSGVVHRARSGWVKGLQLTKGMSQQEVFEAIGYPQRMVEGVYEDSEAELWVYSEVIRGSVDVDLIPTEEYHATHPITRQPVVIHKPVYGDTFRDRIRVTQLIFIDSELAEWKHY